MLAVFRFGAFGTIADGPRTEPLLQTNWFILTCTAEERQTIGSPQLAEKSSCL